MIETDCLYGYARVSTPQQRLQRQFDNLNAAYPGIQIFSDKWNMMAINAPACEACGVHYLRLTGHANETETKMDRIADYSVDEESLIRLIKEAERFVG